MGDGLLVEVFRSLFVSGKANRNLWGRLDWLVLREGRAGSIPHLHSSFIYLSIIQIILHPSSFKQPSHVIIVDLVDSDDMI